MTPLAVLGIAQTMRQVYYRSIAGTDLPGMCACPCAAGLGQALRQCQPQLGDSTAWKAQVQSHLRTMHDQ